MTGKEIQLYVGAGAVFFSVGYWYLHRTHATKVATQNTAGYSSDAGIGNIMTGSSYQGATGPVETYTQNQHYTNYQNYLNSGNYTNTFQQYEQVQMQNYMKQALPYNT